METFKIGHISDLHFSRGADAGASHCHSIDHLQAIQTILAGENLDKLIISGDLTDMGDRESLLRARDWIFGEFSISGSEKIGLEMPEDKVIIVPGNHDAYNAAGSGNALNCWQRSIENYSRVFSYNQDSAGCSYHWLEKNGTGFYIAAIDSCFLGDPTLRHLNGFKKLAIESISMVARGEISIEQSQQLISWFDLGMTGDLLCSEGHSPKIPKDQFATSLKLLVMHHYLFEPPQYAEDFFLKVNDRDTVFRNVAMADFDMYLCGHKHVSDFSLLNYGEHFDRRAKGRYMMNLFRRRLGVNTLPSRVTDSKGKQMAGWLLRVIEIATLKLKSEKPHLDDVQFISELAKLLQDGIEHPTRFGATLQDFVREHRLAGLDVLERKHIGEIRTRICSSLSQEEKTVIKLTGISYIAKIVRGMHERPFIQSMCGSSAKASTSPNTPRSFNIYTFEIDTSNCKVVRKRFHLHDGTDDTNDFTFSNHAHVTLRGR